MVLPHGDVAAAPRLFQEFPLPRGTDPENSIWYTYLFANRRLADGFTFFQFVLQKLSKSKVCGIYKPMRQSCALIEEKR